jgi:putative ABC transport system permease protein
VHTLRAAVRQLRLSPGYAATVVLTFALAIAANSAIFSAVKNVLLRPLPVHAPDDLAVVWQTDEGGQAVIELTYRHLREWRQHGDSFASAAVMGSHTWSAVLHGRGDPAKIWFAGVSADFFSVLGVQPLLGRALRPEDDVPNAAPVAVLSHRAWTRRFGADPAIIGKTMALDSGPVEIIGVMPVDLDVPRGAEFWVPVVPMVASGPTPNTSVLDRVGVFYVIGRVRDGRAVDTLAADLDALEARLDAADPGRLRWGTRSVVTPFLDYVFGPVRPALRVLWVAVGVLLLIACANVSGLLLTRVSRRRHEHAIRTALGASTAAIAGLWTMEVLLLALAGGVLGLAGAGWLTQAIVALAPDDLPRVTDIAIDPVVALCTFAAVVVAALATGAVPMIEMRRRTLLPSAEGERATASRTSVRLRSVLVVGQIALAVVLLVGAGLVLRSFMALRDIDPGFSADRVLSLIVQPGNPGRHPNEWMDTYLSRVRGMPGVEAAGAVLLRPLMLGPIGHGARVILEGQPETRESADANPTVNYQVATPGYFEALRIPLRAGRLFEETDRSGTPRVVIVSESAARRLWPGRDPLGRRLAMPAMTPGSKGVIWRTVVGVVSDVRYRALDEVQLDVYDPALQAGLAADNILVRTASDPLGFTGTLTALARELDPTAVVDSVTTMTAVVRRAEAPWRLTTWMFTLFAGLAFALAALGLFGLVALDVTQRRREFAIRLALGDSQGGIVRRVLTHAGRRVLFGLIIGLAGAVLGTRAMRSLLFDVSAGDPLTYAAVAGLVLLVVFGAAFFPARRAAQVEPHHLLRA